MEEQNTENAKQTKGLPIIAKVAIGCVIILAIIGIIMTLAGKLLVSKFGGNLIKKGIENQTGIKVDTEKESLSFTDKKTGSTINVGGEQKLPDNFPQDFPIYEGAKVTGSLTGNDKLNESTGIWVVMNTPDDISKVKAFYENNLSGKGWSVNNTMTVNDTVTWTVSRGNLSGNVMLTADKNENKTVITISLGNTAEETPPASGE